MDNKTDKREVYANSVEFAKKGCLSTGQMTSATWFEDTPDGQIMSISVYANIVGDDAEDN